MSEITEEQLVNIVAFCALMQNGGGIIDKSPDYVIEKYKQYCNKTTDETLWGLNSIHLSIINRWREKWLPGTVQSTSPTLNSSKENLKT